jgi:hypothetical protein
VIENFADAGLLDVALRAIGLSTHEVDRNEVTPDYGFGDDDVERVFVVPSFEVHGTQQIHPGLILINMAYGFMRAFEMYARYRGVAPTLTLFLLIGGSDRITALRKEICLLEEAVLRVVNENGEVEPVTPDAPLRALTRYAFHGPTLRQIRSLKTEVRGLVVSRVQEFGIESVPIAFDDGAYRNPTLGWWENWERHRAPLDDLLRSFTPWTPLPIRHTIDSAGAVTPVLETGTVAAPVTPQPTRSALGG